MYLLRLLVPLIALAASPSSAQVGSENAAADQELRWMRAVIQQLNASLIDPASAKVELPFGFTPTMMTWRIWGVETTGYFTCGMVNSKNRMGGYVGNTAFLAHISPQGQVTVTMDDPSTAGQRYGGLLILRICNEKRQQGSLPTIRSTTLAALSSSESRQASVSEELAKLARLHADGVLTDAEFAAAKQKILSGG